MSERDIGIVGRLEEAGIDTDYIPLLLIDNLVWPILLVVFLGFSLVLPRLFLTSRNVEFLIFSSAALAAITLAETLCLLSGNFDLSVAATATFSAVVGAKVITLVPDASPIGVSLLGIGVVLATGAAVGLINGLSIVKIGVNPFLQTLSTLIIFEGAVLLVSRSTLTQMPDEYFWIGGGDFGPIPFAVTLIVVLYAAFGVLLKYTRFGRSIYAVGGDEQSAREAGISASRVVLSVYILSGTLAALGGLLLTGFVGAATTTLANGTLFPAFAASIIGGISLFGGRGRVTGALGGVLLLGTVQAGMAMSQIDSFIINTINGVVLLGAIILYTVLEGYRSNLLTSVSE